MKKAVMLIAVLMTAVFTALPVYAVTDGYYDLTETSYSWDGTDADRTRAASADYDYSYGDEENLSYTLPWAFTFYGTSYNSINIESNGNIWFGGYNGTASSFSLANPNHGPVIAAWNNDLSSQFYGGFFVQHKTNPERVVIEWQTETYTEEAGYLENNFEAVLYQTGKIQFNYKSFGTSSSEDSGSGISNNDGAYYVGIVSLAASKSYLAEVKHIVVNPLHDSFGTAYVNVASAERTYTVTNYSSAAATMGSASISGTNSSMFTITSNTCTGSLSPNQSCTIKVSFRPTSTGDKSATLSISATNPSALTRTSTLSGTGVYPQLTVVRQGSDWATITSSTGGISCGDTCSASFDYGSSITLTTTVLPGTTFLGWSGGVCNGPGDCTVVINGDTTVTALYDAPPTGVVKISAGTSYAVALRSDGTLWAWGSNDHGQLGDGTTTNSSIPVQVKNLDGTYSNDWVTVSAGGNYTMAIKKNGSLWAWGHNNLGQLGDGTATDSYSPVQVRDWDRSYSNEWEEVSVGSNFTVGLKKDGSMYAWGSNVYGQLGDGSYTNKLRPYPVFGNSTDWTAVSAGGRHAMAIKKDGTLWAWGFNNLGCLGDGSQNESQIPVQVNGNYTDWAAVSAGGYSTVAIKENGTLWGWGYNYSGQLGDGTIVTKYIPIQVGTDTNWANAETGLGDSTIALKKDGRLYTWGYNNYGQLGDGTTTDRHNPGQVGTDSDWAAASNRGYFTVGLKNDGRLYTWGDNNYGQLGIGNTVQKLTPQMVYGNGWIHTITTSAADGGSISGSTWVYNGYDKTYTITPNTGYHIVDVKVDNVSQGAISSYTFSNVTASHTIDATFAINTYAIIATTGNNGSIAPSGSLTYNYGDSVTFIMTPNPGYHVSDVTVNGISQGAISSYSSTITGNITINATFAINTYTLAVTKSGIGSGTVNSPSGISCGSTCSATVNHGTAVTLDAAVDANSVFIGWSGGCSGVGNCALTVTANTTVDAAFGCSTLPVRILSKGDYSTLQAAYDAAVEGDTIMVQAVTLAENVTANRSISVTINGGYDCAYSTITGTTVLQGQLRTSSGTVNIKDVNIKQ